jgi:hypothetical protein
MWAIFLKGMSGYFPVFLTVNIVLWKRLALDCESAHRKDRQVFKEIFEDPSDGLISYCSILVLGDAIRDRNRVIGANSGNFTRPEEFFEFSALFYGQCDITQPIEERIRYTGLFILMIIEQWRALENVLDDPIKGLASLGEIVPAVASPRSALLDPVTDN